MSQSIRVLKTARTPQNIREEIADILKMDSDERTFLTTVSITYLIERLLDYCHSLEKEIAKKG